MYASEAEKYICSKRGVARYISVEQDVHSFKVFHKVFASIIYEGNDVILNFKSTPYRSIELRRMFSYVYPGYKMNKKHWNSIQLAGVLLNKDILKMIDDAYDLIVENLDKSERDQLEKIGWRFAFLNNF